MATWKDIIGTKRGNGRVAAVATPELPESKIDARRDWFTSMDTVSWVHPFLAVTSHHGASTVEDAVIINVAEELNTKADIKLPVMPENGQDATRERLDMLGNIIANHINNGDKVVVHCMAGIERSALTVAWFLKNHLMFNTLEKAYAHLRKVRPISERRDWWVEGDAPKGAPMVAATKLYKNGENNHA